MSKKLSEMTLEELWQLFPIFLTEYKEHWCSWYKEEETLLSSFLPAGCIINHIGSTSIKGIWAKPIVDILIEVPENIGFVEIKNALVSGGYILMCEEENRLDFNKGYTENGFAEKVFHVHVRRPGDNDEIVFRDYLNEHADVAKEYEKLKLGLWKKFEHNRDGYTNAKTDFVRKWTQIAREENKIHETLKQCYLEEDLFPKLFTQFEERPYGILFFNPDNKDSYDSNHAVIYRDKIDDLPAVLEDIRGFYEAHGSNAIIYQSMLDDAYFEEIKTELAAAGFDSWSEEQKYMLPLGENRLGAGDLSPTGENESATEILSPTSENKSATEILPPTGENESPAGTLPPICENESPAGNLPPVKNYSSGPQLTVRKVDSWSDALKQVFLEAEEPWEIPVLEKSIQNENYWCFAAYLGEKAVGLLYGHVSERACRVDYLLVSKKHRGIGAGNALFNEYINWARANGIKNDYIWPDGEIPEKIYTKGGYRVVEVRTAGRAVFQPVENFLRETKCINFLHPLIAEKICELQSKSSDEMDYIKNAYEFVRDEITHSWDVRAKVVSKTASEVLQNGTGICWAKSCLLAALLRGNKIPCGITYQKLTRADDASDGYIIHALNTVYIAELKKWIRLDARGNKATVHAEFSIKEEKLAFPVRPELFEIDYFNNDVDLDERLIKILDEVDVVMNIRTDFEL